jgi:hypothetical protein
VNKEEIITLRERLELVKSKRHRVPLMTLLEFADYLIEVNELQFAMIELLFKEHL